MCESIGHLSIEKDMDFKKTTTTTEITSKTVPVRKSKEYNINNPRPTKSSLIRMNLNKPNSKESSTHKFQGRRLAANFSKDNKKHGDQSVSHTKTTLSKAEVLKQVDAFIRQQNQILHHELDEQPKANDNNNNISKHEESLPRLPVELRQESQQNSLPNKSLSVILEPTYCPENYSDIGEDQFDSVDDAFDIPSRSLIIGNDNPCSSTMTLDDTLVETLKKTTFLGVDDKIQSNQKDDKLSESIGREHEIGRHQEEQVEVEEEEEESQAEQLEKLSRREETEDLYQLLYKQQNQLLALEKQV